MKTISLYDIKNELEENVFDFNYDWTDITVGGIIYNKEYIENAFNDYYLHYQIGYSTLEEFKWRLRRNWLEKISILQQQLSVYPTQIRLNDRTITRDFTNSSDNKYSDTPNQPMLNVDPQGQYLTDRTYIDNSGNSTVNETRNELDKYNEIKKKITNVLYSWLKEFECLFITDIIIRDYIGG